MIAEKGKLPETIRTDLCLMNFISDLLLTQMHLGILLVFDIYYFYVTSDILCAVL